MKSLDFPARFIELATEINSGMPRHVVRLASDLLNEDRLPVNGSRILILGVAYKPDVADVRESPARDLIDLLQAKGALVEYHDPHVSELEVDGKPQKSSDLDDAALVSSDLVIIVTNHTGIDYGRVVQLAPRILDTRNATRDVTAGREKVRKL
jgi:UDP-N-acetyl-D-glucosamine dehydrogenase